jgi:Tfp pilus assembly protein PilF
VTLRRFYPAIGVSSLVLLALAIALGFYQGVARDGRIPGIALDYMPDIQAALAAGDTAAAIDQLRAAVVIDPANTNVAAMLARLAAEHGDRAAEILALRHLLREAPEDVQARTRLAAAFLEQARGRPSGARRSDAAVRAAWQAEKALEFAPDTPEAHRVAAEALQLLGQEDRARVHLDALAASTAAATPDAQAPAGAASELRP